MKRVAFLLVAFFVVSLAIGCRRGPPTLAPTRVFPPTDTPTPTETPSPTATPVRPEDWVPTDTPIPHANVRRQATLRTGPGVQYPVAGTASFGEILIVYARCEGWLLISPDASKWIIEGKVLLDVDVEAVPVGCEPPEEPTPEPSL